MVEALLEQRSDVDERIGDSALGDLVHHGLGPVDGHGHVVGEVVADLRDLAGNADQPPQQSMVFDNARVMSGVAGGGRARLERQQGREAAHQVVQVGAAQFLGDGDGVDRLALRVQGADGVVDMAVDGLVEVVGAQVDVDGRGDGVARQQHGAEERLLGLQVVGRHAADTALATPGVVDGLHHGLPTFTHAPCA